MANNLLTIVVPCYNEEEVLPETVKELGKILNDLILYLRLIHQI